MHVSKGRVRLCACVRGGRRSYHLVVAVGREEVVSQVEESQDAADSPHVDGLGEGEAERNLWRSERSETRAETKHL